MCVLFCRQQFAVTSVQTLDIVAEKRQRTTPIFDFRYSPDGKLLAVATKALVDVYDAEKFERKYSLEVRRVMRLRQRVLVRTHVCHMLNCGCVIGPLRCDPSS